MSSRQLGKRVIDILDRRTPAIEVYAKGDPDLVSALLKFLDEIDPVPPGFYVSGGGSEVTVTLGG